MQNSSSKNYKVKRLAVYTLFPRLFNLTQPILQLKQSLDFLSLIESASKIDWGSKEENEKHLMQLLNLNK